MITETELKAIRKYLHHLAENWWNSQPASRSTATCDACSYESIKRNDGYLVGSNLWCEKCYEEKAVMWIKEEGADKMLGYGVLAEAMKMFGTTGKKSDKTPSPVSNEERLILAAKEGDVQTVRALLDAGTDVNATVEGYAGMTPLMHASRSNHVDCVKVLISAGANVRMKNELGRTALKIAEGNGNREIVKLLEEAGAREE